MAFRFIVQIFLDFECLFIDFDTSLPLISDKNSWRYNLKMESRFQERQILETVGQLIFKEVR